jgi:hypothetical protein
LLQGAGQCSRQQQATGGQQGHRHGYRNVSRCAIFGATPARSHPSCTRRGRRALLLFEETLCERSSAVWLCF